MDSYNRRSRLTRRTFGALTAGGVAAALIPPVIAQSTTERAKRRQATSLRRRGPRIARTPTPAELEARVAPPLPISPAERKRAQEIAFAAKALVLKGLLNRLDARRYPVPGDRNSPEARIAQALRQVSDSRFQRIRPRLADHSLAARLDPGLKTIRFTEPRLELLSNLSLRPAPGIIIPPGVYQPTPLKGPPPPGPVVPLSGGWDGQAPYSTDLGGIPSAPVPVYNNIIAELISLRCITETSGDSADDIILGAIVIGADGRMVVHDAFVANGNEGFDTGTWVDFGARRLASLPLNVTPGFPKDFYIRWILVESDSNDQEVADGVNQGLHIIADVVGYFNAAAGVIVYAASEIIDVIAGAFIDEDPFPPKDVPLRLNSLTQFEGAEGAGGVSKVYTTPSIKQDDGEYLIYYRWKLTS